MGEQDPRRRAARARSRAHRLEVESIWSDEEPTRRLRAARPQRVVGYRARCGCGWVGTSTAQRVDAIVSWSLHVGHELELEREARRAGEAELE